MTRPRYRLASGHGSGTHSWGPNPRHIGRKAGQGGSSPPGGWAGPCGWGPNPRHMGGFFERRLQAYGRGRIAGGPTPDIWGARGSGPYNSAWGPHGQVGFVASRRVGTP
eukprot:gene20979-biopygen23606